MKLFINVNFSFFILGVTKVSHMTHILHLWRLLYCKCPKTFTVWCQTIMCGVFLHWLHILMRHFKQSG